MGLVVSQGNSAKFELLPEGTYIARCYKIIDLGTQVTEWAGEKKAQHKVLISWEILDEDVRMEDGRPFGVSKRYTASLHEKAQLRKDLEAWRGKRFTDEELAGFELKNVLGAYCTVQVVHIDGQDGSTFANMNAIMATKAKPQGVNPDTVFDIDKPDMNLFESFSDRLKDQIKASYEWKAMSKPKEVAEITDEDVDTPIDLSSIPF